jgi:hypothetical protein
MRKRILLVIVAATAVLMAMSPRVGDAIGSRRSGVRGVPTTVAVVASRPYPGADAVIIRRVSVLPHDLILIYSGVASPEYVAATFHALAVTRARHGDIPDKDRVVRVDAPTRTLKYRATPLMVLEMLRVAVPREVAGFGRMATVVVSLPPQRH